MAAITLEDVSKRFGDATAVHPLDLTLADGSFTVLVGPSGCGKTTILRMLAGLEMATSGTITIDGVDVTDVDPRDRDVSMVFQNYALYPHLNVRRNIGFALEAHRQPRELIRDKVQEAAEMLGIEELLDRRPGALSGGQQQRVAIARAIVRDPTVFLFDEPLSNLDAKLRVKTRTELLRLQRQLGATMVYVTHDQEEAMVLADDLLVMSQGRVMQRGRPSDVYRQPASEFVAQFIGSPEINVFDGTSQAGRGRIITDLFEVPTPAGVAGPVRLAVRPDDVHRPAELPPDRTVGSFRAEIDVIEMLGSSAVLYLDASGHEVRAVVNEAQLEDLHEGDKVDVALDAERLHLFDPDSGDRLPG